MNCDHLKNMWDMIYQGTNSGKAHSLITVFPAISSFGLDEHRLPTQTDTMAMLVNDSGLGGPSTAIAI